MSNEAQWTPGPWIVAPIEHLLEKHRKDTPTFYTATVEPALSGSYRGPICHMQSCEHINGITGPECEANARLIAAAPEMAALLEACATHLGDCARDIGIKREHSMLEARGRLAEDMATRARALLAKIKG